MSRSRAAAAVAWLALLALAACGGGGGGGVGGGSDTAVGGDSSGTSGGQRDDQTIVREANLRLADFPAEWRVSDQAAGADEASEEGDRARALCMGRPPPEEVRTASARSQDFSAQDTRRVSSSVQVVRTVEIARDDFAALRDDRAAGCLQTQIDAEFRRQLPNAAAQSTVERVNLPQFGEETVGYRYAATSQAQGGQVRTYIDFVWVRKGRVELNGGFINQGTPFPSELERSLLQRMVGRV